jgi:hypothetical protein
VEQAAEGERTTINRLIVARWQRATIIQPNLTPKIVGG